MTARATRVQPQTKRLSAVEVVAATLAAVSAAVAASALGVEGTVTGAAVGSVVATLGSAVYAKSLTHTHHRLKDLRPRRTALPVPSEPAAAPRVDGPATAVASGGPAAPTGSPSRAPGAVYGRRRRRWPLMVAVAVAAFGLAIAMITGVELAIGKPLANLYGGHTGGGTTIGDLTGPAPSQPGPPGPTVDQPPSIGPGAEPSDTPSASTSDRPATPSPTAASKPAASVPPSAAPTPNPQVTPQPTP